MNSDQSSPDSVSAALIEILRDDLNIDVSRVTQESRLVDDVGLERDVSRLILVREHPAVDHKHPGTFARLTMRP